MASFVEVISFRSLKNFRFCVSFSVLKDEAKAFVVGFLDRVVPCERYTQLEPRFDPDAVRLSVNKDANSVQFHCCVYLWLSLESASVQQQLPVLEVIKVYGKLAGLRLARRVKKRLQNSNETQSRRQCQQQQLDSRSV